MMTKPANTKLKIAFFGTSDFAVDILEQLKISGGLTSRDFVPNLIVTTPDKPAGRKLKMTPPPVKVWADENDIPTLQPEKLDEKFLSELKNFSSQPWNLFIVAAYGKIIPPEIFNLPQCKTINVHPSLLPKFRGATPLHSVILSGEKETGVSLILLDEQMDHGPIIAQEKFKLWENSISEMPTQSQLEKTLAQLSGKLLGNWITKWVGGEVEAVDQDHSQATYTQKLKSDDARIKLNDDPRDNFKKIQAFDVWPKAHFFHNGKRVIIKKARLVQDELMIEKVLVAGGQAINYQDLPK